MTKHFKVGQTYSGRFICDYDSIANFTILGRTAKSVRVSVHGKIVTRRVSEYCGVEQFKPFGSYSMAMVIDANDPDLSAPKPAEQSTFNLMNEGQLATLRAQLSQIKTIDPCGPTFPRLTAYLDTLSKPVLHQLAGARLPWLSALARNRV